MLGSRTSSRVGMSAAAAAAAAAAISSLCRLCMCVDVEGLIAEQAARLQQMDARLCSRPPLCVKVGPV